MRILVSGSTGFIGYSLVPALVAQGHEVHQLVRYRAGRWDGYAPGALHFADLRDAAEVLTQVAAARPDIIIHLAAISAVSMSFANDAEVLHVNLMGTRNLAQAALKAHVTAFVHASTSEVYGNATQYPTPEEHHLSGLSPYAASKIAAEEYLHTLERIHGLPLIIVRPFNTIGRALVDNRHFVVERAITGALLEKRISLHDPRPLRDFLWRDDHVRGYGKVVEKLPIGETINLCTGQCWSIEEMARTVAALVGDVEVNFAQTPDRPLDIDRLQGDNSKARALLDWAPRYSLQAGLSQAIAEWRERLHV